MDLEKLRYLQAKFMSNDQLYDKHLKKYTELEKLRSKFVKRYSPEKILDLSLEEYVIGKNNKNNFCYWLERKLDELGSIRGSFAIKFGIYYNRLLNN